MKTILYIPTLNAGRLWSSVIQGINKQLIQPDRIVIIDSGSTDDTLLHPSMKDFEIIHIDKKDFDHGGTRQMAVNRFPDADLYLFLTQDAILANEHSLGNLIKVFDENPQVGVAYGRQLPHIGSKGLETHARLFNYPANSQLRGLASRSKYGIKTASCSNSFAAYRKTAFEEAGGFPSGTILGEDVIAAGRIILNGWQLAYVADAQAYHSHSYSVKEEFKRYFDIGVFHATNSWIFQHFGHAESEGFRYVKSEFSYIIKHRATELPKAFFSTGAKWLGYKLGLFHKYLPSTWNKHFSMHKAYWK
ncbi:glycosyltransferase [Olivibacter sp. CPCC 100613]|uniref:glycosyltransferase family 2 protein n=1 Tax=Olivibacter sp. CPCC 100613 TaxID=3079931 RepID=UPI002FFC2978